MNYIFRTTDNGAVAERMRNMVNEIYDRQTGAIVFIMALCFKIGVLPGLLANQVDNPLPMVFAACVIELLMYACVIKFTKNGGMDLLKSESKIFYNAVLGVLLLYFLVKGIVLTGSLVLMIEQLLFDNISVYLVIITLLATVAYLAVKGIKGIARLSEMLVLILALSMLVNLVFLKSRMNFSNNLPVITDDLVQYFKAWGSYGAWFFDSVPFLFITIKSRGKRHYIGAAYLIAFAFIMTYYFLGNALFGKYLFGIDNFLVKLSSFNFLSEELGRLDWTGIISWVVICMINMSVLLWAAIEAGGRIFKKRNAVAAAVVVITAVAVAVLDPFDYRKFADISWFGYTLCAVGFAVPLAVYIFSAVVKRKKGLPPDTENEDENEENSGNAEEPEETARDGKGDGVYSEEAKSGGAGKALGELKSAVEQKAESAGFKGRQGSDRKKSGDAVKENSGGGSSEKGKGSKAGGDGLSGKGSPSKGEKTYAPAQNERYAGKRINP
ncbi:MAG: spore germination protein [Clostridiaceae bacterium]|jgi:hypothetical protein|nr:spore germination protein [Clostridiaceae bacterium]